MTAAMAANAVGPAVQAAVRESQLHGVCEELDEAVLAHVVALQALEDAREQLSVSLAQVRPLPRVPHRLCSSGGTRRVALRDMNCTCGVGGGVEPDVRVPCLRYHRASSSSHPRATRQASSHDCWQAVAAPVTMAPLPQVCL